MSRYAKTWKITFMRSNNLARGTLIFAGLDRALSDQPEICREVEQAWANLSPELDPQDEICALPLVAVLGSSIGRHCSVRIHVLVASQAQGLDPCSRSTVSSTQAWTAFIFVAS